MLNFIILDLSRSYQIYLNRTTIQLYIMEAFNIFSSKQKTNIKDPFHTFCHNLNLSLSIVYISYFYVYLSAVDFKVILTIYQIDFNPILAQSILQSIMGLGGLFGACTPAFFLSRLSRRNSLLFINCFSLLICLASVYPSYHSFVVIRFLQGAVGGMMNAIVPMIIKESTPLEMATLTGALTNLSFFVGYFITYAFGYLLNVISGDMTGASTWRILFLAPAVLIVIQTLLLCKVFPYETPKYLAEKKLNSQLQSLLQTIYKPQHVQKQLQNTLKQYDSQHNSHSQKQVDGHYCSKTALLFGCIYALSTTMAGVSAFIVFCKQQLAKIFPTLQPVLGALTMLIYCIFSAASMGFSSPYGRKKTTIVGACCVFAANYLIAVGFFLHSSYPTLSQAIVLFSYVSFLLIITTTLGPTVWIWIAQAIQPRYIGYAIMMNWLGASVNSILFPILKNVLPNEGFTYLFFGTWVILFVPVAQKLMVQTKGKLDIQIAREYKVIDDGIWGESKKKEVQIQLLQKI